MSDRPYTVHVVVDPEYGERLKRLPEGEPVWVVDTPSNSKASLMLRRERQPADHLTGFTTFKCDTASPAEERFLGIMSDVELHHGEPSHDPPYSVLNVIGVEWSSRIAEVLASIGFHRHEPTAEGFVATKGTSQPYCSDDESTDAP